ncbi:hypothetical protein K1T71_007784 [Dendrolimus kikuchii]|uniref:Uncharacterized protein n=1 Tax=Dendrolimus kikuchii TaxID=765133 RepID=A0ACC1CYG1_9NEOP|nr:hypothetical protein K1T71_007784 [Dendrolimus kikuchii]
MLIVPTNFSDSFTMAESSVNIEDLEDGEIESEGEDNSENNQHDIKSEEPSVPPYAEKINQEKLEPQDHYYSKSGKKKKSKSNKGESKFKDKKIKNRKYSSPTEDDFAGSIEKAIRKAMNKNDNEDLQNEDDVDDRRKHKKRKRTDPKDESGKKRKKQEYQDEMDESEMMCVRGASPVQRQSPGEAYQEDERDSYASDSSQDSRGNQNHRQHRHRQQQRDRMKNKNDRRRVAPHPMQDPDGVCLYFMQGRCHMGDDCVYSHDAQPPRKMELCKFYLMDCCAKRDKCLYMHADFPCKYYHTGLPCIYKDECKFAHGKPLTENLKNILLKHIESAPKEILGDFPRLNREGALKMIQTTQIKLMNQFPETIESQEKAIPSLFELNIPNPQIQQDNSLQFNQFNNERSNKISPKVRQSRWQNENVNQNFNLNLSPNNNTNASNVLSIKNLTGVLTPRQISDLTKMGIENLDQLGQLTVLQLNSIGLSLKQITEIQLNTMNIQKLGLINTTNETQPQQFVTSTGPKDLDLRVPPIVPVSASPTVASDLPGMDIDMRFQSSMVVPAVEDNKNLKVIQKDINISKDMIDIDQYTKDALKFVSKDKENIDISNESYDHEKPIASSEQKDVDHRVLPFSEEAPKPPNSVDTNVKKECDTDIRFLQPEPLFKNPERRNRRSTTDDDEDNNLLIDDKWYSSDEEKGIKKKSPISSPQQLIMSPQTPRPHIIEPSTVLSRLGDLSKIDISEEVTKLLNTMKKNTQDIKKESNIANESVQKTRDPRAKRSPDKTGDHGKPIHKKPTKISIYECVDGEPTDGRRRTDVDLRKSDFIPAFGDTDLRQSTSGDIDFRLGLPFKPIPNYTPASEIDGSINSHPPISYKLVPIHIPRPDYTDIRNSTAKSQALLDPRLRKVFRLSVEESNSDNEKPLKPVSTAPRVDPRKRPKDNIESSVQDQKINSLDIQTILQSSNWYKELSSTQKIFVNQHLAPVTQTIKQFQQEKALGKKFDLGSIQSNTILCNIFTNLGISLGENGEYTYLPKPKEALLKTPVGFNQNANPFGNMPLPPGAMDGSNMNMLNMPPMNLGTMNNMNLGNVHFNQPLSDPRGGPTPGLLGIAPNIPHNFNNAKFGGPNNFSNMPFNGPGPGNDFNFMDGEQNYPRFPNRGGHRGRGNDRWNRGSSARGNRERKNFNDRGNWKNDRN